MKLPRLRVLHVIALVLGCACDPGHRAKSAPAPEEPRAQPAASLQEPSPKSDSSSAETIGSAQQRLPTPALQPAPRSATERTVKSKSGPAPAISCERDEDCVVKNVGNCCGRFLKCVHQDFEVDPDAVLRKCEAENISSTCGFVEISSCQCVSGLCRNGPPGPAVR